MTSLLKDKFDRTINTGDTVVYPVRRGSQMDLKSAVVTGIVGEEIHALTVGADDRSINVKLKHPKRCAIVELS